MAPRLGTAPRGPVQSGRDKQYRRLCARASIRRGPALALPRLVAACCDRSGWCFCLLGLGLRGARSGTARNDTAASCVDLYGWPVGIGARIGRPVLTFMPRAANLPLPVCCCVGMLGCSSRCPSDAAVFPTSRWHAACNASRKRGQASFKYENLLAPVPNYQASCLAGENAKWRRLQQSSFGRQALVSRKRRIEPDRTGQPPGLPALFAGPGPDLPPNPAAVTNRARFFRENLSGVTPLLYLYCTAPSAADQKPWSPSPSFFRASGAEASFRYVPFGGLACTPFSPAAPRRPRGRVVAYRPRRVGPAARDRHRAAHPVRRPTARSGKRRRQGGAILAVGSGIPSPRRGILYLYAHASARRRGRENPKRKRQPQAAPRRREGGEKEEAAKGKRGEAGGGGVSQMGKYMRKCRGAAGEEVAGVEVTQVVGVRTRSRTAAAPAPAGGVAKVAPRRKKALAPPNVAVGEPDAGGDGGSCYIKLRSRTLFMAPPQQPSMPRVPVPAEAAGAGQGAAAALLPGLSRCSSTASSVDVGFQDRSLACRSDAVEAGGDHNLEISASNSGSGPERERRETTPSSRAHGEVSDLESDLAGQKKNGQSSPATTSVPQLITPPADEIKAFFAAAEKEQAERFAAKYNFDVVRGVPLDGGQFEWTPVVSI
ncbi:hypothetical protein C2845_PM11G24920 [Panicum miliaceum]|uniref:Cyclin-dependent kinase inhibitor domain-containing protein n=1 Tax=Panicum miliaceum TaxID=4540 RepID=A0A3L6RVM1_PANMI|nr:hypothetical protein C2845_PM11G24920 [Panicum miliaceum]